MYFSRGIYRAGVLAARSTRVYLYCRTAIYYSFGELLFAIIGGQNWGRREKRNSQREQREAPSCSRKEKELCMSIRNTIAVGPWFRTCISDSNDRLLRVTFNWDVCEIPGNGLLHGSWLSSGTNHGCARECPRPSILGRRSAETRVFYRYFAPAENVGALSDSRLRYYKMKAGP